MWTLEKLAAYGKNLLLFTPNINFYLGEVSFINNYIIPKNYKELTQSYITIDKIKPYLRGMVDLKKEIIVEGYNDSKPFIPLVKLFEVVQDVELQYDDEYDKFYYIDDFEVKWFVDLYTPPNDMVYNSFIITNELYGTSFINMDLNCVDLLNQWQFNWRGYDYLDLNLDL